MPESKKALAINLWEKYIKPAFISTQQRLKSTLTFAVRKVARRNALSEAHENLANKGRRDFLKISSSFLFMPSKGAIATSSKAVFEAVAGSQIFTPLSLSPDKLMFLSNLLNVNTSLGGILLNSTYRSLSRELDMISEFERFVEEMENVSGFTTVDEFIVLTQLKYPNFFRVLDFIFYPFHWDLDIDLSPLKDEEVANALQVLFPQIDKARLERLAESKQLRLMHEKSRKLFIKLLRVLLERYKKDPNNEFFKSILLNLYNKINIFDLKRAGHEKLLKELEGVISKMQINELKSSYNKIRDFIDKSEISFIASSYRLARDFVRSNAGAYKYFAIFPSDYSQAARVLSCKNEFKGVFDEITRKSGLAIIILVK